MILLAEAERARDISSALDLFRKNITRDESVSDAIDELRSLRYLLQDLDRSIVARNGVINNVELFDDLELLQHSVAYTLQDVWTILGQMPDQAIGHDYRSAWKSIQRHCSSSRQQSLARRLNMYNLFARALVRQLNSQQAPLNLIAELRDDILALRRLQLSDRRYIDATEAINDLSALAIRAPPPPPPPIPQSPPPVNTGPMRQPRSTERVRPPAHRTMSPTETNASWDSVQRPSFSSPPQSPISPATTFSKSGSMSSADTETKHWAGRIFSDLPSTDIPDDKNRDKRSECFPMGPDDGSPMPDPEEYEKVLQIKFAGDFRCHYWVRERDFRTKLVCQYPHPKSRQRMISQCLPLNELHSRREGSMLYLCRAVAGVGQNTAWVAFKFPTIEFLIIFHCTFVALRSFDGRRRAVMNFDVGIKNEKTHFSAPIRDNGYHHILRVLRDRSTNCVRLEACVDEGPLKDTPIWTAFITHHVTSTRWIKESRRAKSVYLSDLKRHVFSSQYSPPAGQAALVLDFDLEEDADGFEMAIRQIGEAYRKEASGTPSKKKK